MLHVGPLNPLMKRYAHFQHACKTCGWVYCVNEQDFCGSLQQVLSSKDVWKRMFIPIQPSSHQDGRCCGWTARSWRGWESSRRHWGRRSFSKSSSCKSGKKSATCSSLAEVSLSVWACICVCVCLWADLILFVSVSNCVVVRDGEKSRLCDDGRRVGLG